MQSTKLMQKQPVKSIPAQKRKANLIKKLLLCAIEGVGIDEACLIAGSAGT